ncbi:hypothetical protein IAR50_004119 [Cryptococcus sp. DSM 104548]
MVDQKGTDSPHKKPVSDGNVQPPKPKRGSLGKDATEESRTVPYDIFEDEDDDEDEDYDVGGQKGKGKNSMTPRLIHASSKVQADLEALESGKGIGLSNIDSLQLNAYVALRTVNATNKTSQAAETRHRDDRLMANLKGKIALGEITATQSKIEEMKEGSRKDCLAEQIVKDHEGIMKALMALEI